ncbi:alpha,alpha-trehalose-phosphate synthase (UDP-forming) [Rhodoplanes serenus]|uniref:alpha,alpha-trehalose-phosphate synthase (UDP-forming) n=1 Tax=Rhodoplanes serenus TaxID=200615 RepID=UPI000DADA1E8|nr:trehalose-6-phosphate synthase [Rhodoplanes serenus]RAI35006.1 trehalose-6-phosphate synthase [Rhodoplanes serenus]
MDIVVVSNRVARLDAEEPMTGGLAAALLPVVRDSGAIWVGSSGRTRDTSVKEPLLEVAALGKGALATVDLPAAHYRGYYEGFSNSALWPALHSRADLVRVEPEDYAAYREVNAYMARALMRFCRNEATMIWVQDYHFLPLGAELRRLGVTQPIGFFLHTPLPGRDMLAAVPHHRELIEAMLAYDLIGFQTVDGQRNFADYVRRELGLTVRSAIVRSRHGETRLGTFPIGIDTALFAERATKAAARPEVSRLRSSLQGAKLVVGVDRIDYSKGLANRLRGFAALLETQPSFRRAVTLLQVAVPSRSDIPTYRALEHEVATLVGNINGRFGEPDWTPVRYLNKGFSQTTLAGFYRTAGVGLVTPLNDGMNLVAKEYVAAQNPFDPGVLILSEFAGAARELEAALLLNPHDTAAIARALARALGMSQQERCERWETNMKVLRASPVQLWFSDFVRTLDDQASMALPVVAEVPALPGAQGVSTLSTVPTMRGSEAPVMRFERH